MSTYLNNFFKAKATLKYLGSTEQDKRIKKAFELLDELNKNILATDSTIKNYMEYTTNIQDLMKANPDLVPGTIYKSRKRLGTRLEKTFYGNLPNELVEGDEDALSFIFYLYDTVQINGTLENNLLFGDVLTLSEELLVKPETVNITAGSFIKYAPELDFLKQYVQVNYADNLLNLDMDRISQLIYTLKDPTFNPQLYKLAIGYFLNTGEKE